MNLNKIQKDWWCYSIKIKNYKRIKYLNFSLQSSNIFLIKDEMIIKDFIEVINIICGAKNLVPDSVILYEEFDSKVNIKTDKLFFIPSLINLKKDLLENSKSLLKQLLYKLISLNTFTNDSLNLLQCQLERFQPIEELSVLKTILEKFKDKYSFIFQTNIDIAKIISENISISIWDKLESKIDENSITSYELKFLYISILELFSHFSDEDINICIWKSIKWNTL